MSEAASSIPAAHERVHARHFAQPLRAGYEDDQQRRFLTPVVAETAESERWAEGRVPFLTIYPDG